MTIEQAEEIYNTNNSCIREEMAEEFQQDPRSFEKEEVIDWILDNYD